MSWLSVAVLAAASIASSVDAQTTSRFGYRSDPFHGGTKFHAGMDMAGRVGTPIYATGDGIVVRSRWAGGYGNLVEIDHGFGYVTRFGHLSQSLVQEGQFVRRGQMIALMGSTGHSTGPHLHYEVRIGGSAVDPSRYMQIAFTQQPDWNAVRMADASARQRPAASVAMAMVQGRSSRVRGRSEDLSKVGDLEIDYGSGNGRKSSQALAGPSFASERVSYGR